MNKNYVVTGVIDYKNADGKFSKCKIAMRQTAICGDSALRHVERRITNKLGIAPRGMGWYWLSGPVIEACNE